ncbi:YcaO-like family protein [uncultured Paludibaculum sp.]|uniref:YcaO-like family protein n=1 Tax=uncultured Paludibaculum sp. TaxID=1765020 RepID=UPI002AAA6E46|nr:YcaO-like family protein [uncultured Paludibaculum sp.]
MPSADARPPTPSESTSSFLRQLEPFWPEAEAGRPLYVCFDLRSLAQAADNISPPCVFLLVSSDLAIIGEVREGGTCPPCLSHWIALSQFDRDGSPQPLPDNAANRVGAFLRDYVQGPARTPSTVRSLDFRTNVVQQHPVYRRGDCVRCSREAAPDSLPLHVHCSPLTGIVHRVQVSDAPSAGAFRAHAVWHSPLPVGRARPLLRRQASFGRGRTAEEAINGAIGEALERYSLIYRGNEAITRATAAELEILHPDSIQLYSAAQRARQDRWNAMPDEIFHIPAPFDPTRPVDWLSACDLHGGPDRYVPAACCLMWYQFQPGEPRFASADTIGCGSGRTFDDALLHALLEWIERDAMSLWWYNRARRPAVRLASLDAPEVMAVEEGLRAIGRSLFLLDCTTDLGIPAYVSVAPRLDGSEVLFAGAAHPSPRVAAWKAASEVAQVWTTAQTTHRLPDSMRPWLLNETLERQPYLAPFGTIDAAAEPPAMSTASQIQVILDRLRTAGLRAYAVDHSRPDVLLHTARAIVPGLRHIWNRRAPGRLYEVPPRLGWLPGPLAEEELNPICCMI